MIQMCIYSGCGSLSKHYGIYQEVAIEYLFNQDAPSSGFKKYLNLYIKNTLGTSS